MYKSNVIRAVLFVTSLVFVFGGTSVFAQDDDQQKPSKGQLLDAPEIRYERDRVSGVAKSAQPSSIVYEEGFEGDVSGWTGEGVWAIGEPTSGPGGGFESPSAGATNLEGDYPNSADDRLISPSISLPEVSSAGEIRVHFREWFEIESEFDEGIVEISSDGGDTWTGLSSRSGTSGWRDTQIDLTSYSGQEVKLAFRLSSDGSIKFPGWYVDEIQIVQNEGEPLSATITGLNPQKFPFVFSNVEVDTSGEGVEDLSESNFEVYEDDVLQTDRYEVIPPEEGGGARRADVVFLVDNTGSMGGEIDQVQNNIISFTESLESYEVDFSLGLVTYKDNVSTYFGGTLTENVDEFQEEVAGLSATGGGSGPENGLGALQVGLSSISFRPGSQKVFVLITDATSHTPPPPYADSPDPEPLSLEDINESMNEAGVTTYAAAIDDPVYKGEGSITSATEGNFFFVTEPFDSILDDIGEEVSDSYVVRYRSSNDERDGTERTMRVEVTYEGNTAQDVASYVAGGFPQITRTEETRSLEEQTWTEGTDFTIEAEITDEVAPSVQEATVFYKTTSDPTAAYESVAMSAVDESLYEATIPGSAVSSPGLDYYITATDGEVTSSLPSTSPANTPYQIAILPNEPPEIDHTPVTELTSGSPIPISATVIDDTDALESTTLYYRQIGDLTYTTVEMTNTGGDTYEAEIPGSEVTDDGVQYYIEATDNFGVRNTEGTRDLPIEVTQDPLLTFRVVHPTAVDIDSMRLFSERVGVLSEKKDVTASTVDPIALDLVESKTSGDETLSFFAKSKNEVDERFDSGIRDDDKFSQIRLYRGEEVIGFLPFRYTESDLEDGCSPDDDVEECSIDAIVQVHDEESLKPNLDDWSDKWDYYDETPDVDDPYPLSMLVPPRGSMDSVETGEKRPAVLVHGVSGRYPSWGDDIETARGLVGTLSGEGYDAWQFYYPENQDITKSGPLLAKAIHRLQNSIGYGEDQTFDVVSHSMGGLVSRHYIQRMGIGSDRSDYSSVLDFDPGEPRENVDKFLMLGTPNHGSYSGYLCTGSADTFIGGGADTLCEKGADKDVGAPAMLQMTPGNGFLSRLNFEGDYSGAYSTGSTLVLAGAESTPIPPVMEIPGQDDGLVAVSSASLLNLGVPLAVGDFVHAGANDPSDLVKAVLNEDTREIIADFLAGDYGPKMVDRFNGNGITGNGVTAYWRGGLADPYDPTPANQNELDMETDEGILIINAEGTTYKDLRIGRCVFGRGGGMIGPANCIRVGEEGMKKVPGQDRFFSRAFSFEFDGLDYSPFLPTTLVPEFEIRGSLGFEEAGAVELSRTPGSISASVQKQTPDGWKFLPGASVDIEAAYLQTRQARLGQSEEERAIAEASGFTPSVGTSASGETSTASTGSAIQKDQASTDVDFLVDAATDTLSFWVTQDSIGDFSAHNTRLISPDGTTIDSSRAKSESELGYTQNLELGSLVYVVEDPTPGQWTVRHDASVSATVSAPVRSTVDLRASTPDSTFSTGETVPVELSFSDRNTYENTDIDAQLRVEDPEDGTVKNLGSIELTERAATTYEGTFSPSYIGSYQIVADFSARVDGESVLRRTVESIRVTGDSTETVPDPPPAPSELAAEFSESGGVTLDWSSPSSGTVDEYRIYRDTIPDPTRQVTTVSSGQTSYTDSEARKGQTYYYRVTAAGAEGVESDYTDASSIFTYPSSLSVDVQRSFGSLNSEQGYRLVALPGAANQSLGETLSGEAGTEWQAWWDDGSSQDYFQKFDGSDTFRFRAGRGFWALSKSDWSVQQSVETVPLESGQPHTSIPLHDGWNIISNPFGEEVSWNAVNAAHSDSLRALWRFDGSFAEADTFRSARVGEAFYFLNDTGLDSLKVPYPTGSAVKSQAAGKSQEKKSLVTIRARSKNGDGPASAVKVGFDEEAAEGLDRLDEPAPPGRFSELSLRLQAPGEAPPRRRSLMTERRPPKGGPEKGHTFDLRLQATTGVPIQITASGLEENRSAEAKLLRPSTGRSYDLVEGTPVAIEEADSTGLKLAIGSASYVEEQAKQIVPDEVRLTSYPNPTRGQATIEYTLPEAQEVTLEVYDVLGRRVATLENGRRQAGRHTLRLDGGSLPSGVYFGRLEAGEQTRSQKITVVR